VSVNEPLVKNNSFGDSYLQQVHARLRIFERDTGELFSEKKAQ
jgi:hypothetical protein